MGWSLGFDDKWKRDVGYGVPAYCDHPKCSAEINRGLAYVCCDQQPYGGERGCGLFFCEEHRDLEGRCPRCRNRKTPYEHPSADHLDWVQHKLTDLSWRSWRRQNKREVQRLTARVIGATPTPTPRPADV